MYKLSEEEYMQAFEKGALKRAEELGLDKEAFVGPLLGGMLRIGTSFMAAPAMQAGLARAATLAKRKGVYGMIGRQARKANKLLNAKGFGGQMANAALFAGSGMLADPLVDPIARRLEGQNNQQQDY